MKWSRYVQHYRSIAEDHYILQPWKGLFELFHCFNKHEEDVLIFCDLVRVLVTRIYPILRVLFQNLALSLSLNFLYAEQWIMKYLAVSS